MAEDQAQNLNCQRHYVPCPRESIVYLKTGESLSLLNV